MQALLLPLIQSAGTLFAGLGAGGATAAAAGSGVLSTVGTVASTVAGLATLSYQSKIAKNAASIAEQNAVSALHRGQTEQQQQDEAAAAQLAQITSAQAASGFNTGSPSYQRAMSRNRQLAQRDALNIRQAASLEAQGYQAQAADLRAQAKNSGLGLSLVAGATDIGASLIGGAQLVRKAKAGLQNTDTRGYQT